MEEVIKKIISIDNEAIKMEENAKKIVEEKENSLKTWLDEIENKEEKKAKREIEIKEREIQEKTTEELEKIKLQGQNKLEKIEEGYNKNKEELKRKAIERILST